MKRIFAFTLCFLLIFTLVSCIEEMPSARELLVEFTDSYGIGGVLYSPDFSEGESGYIDAEFFNVMYDASPDFESDYAVFLSSSIDSIYEAAVFVTRDSSSLLFAERLCLSRLALLDKMGYAESAVFIKRDNTVFYSTLPDGKRAESIWRDVKIRI